MKEDQPMDPETITYLEINSPTINLSVNKNPNKNMLKKFKIKPLRMFKNKKLKLKLLKK